MHYNMQIIQALSIRAFMNSILTTRILSILILLFSYSNIQANIQAESSGTTSLTVYTNKNYDAIGEYVSYLTETEQTLNLEQAQVAYAAGNFLKWKKPVLSFGIGASPVWLRFTVTNKTEHAVQRRLIVENSWLDHADVFIIKDGQTVFREQSGDNLPYPARAIKHRFLVFEHNYAPGTSVVYLRADTPDPMILPIFFGDNEASSARDLINGYSYGMLYGILIALLLYNLLLYLSIKQTRYFYYVVYLLLFLFMNFSYTGHGYKLLWPDSPWLQEWINPFSITLFATSGILFAFSFLKIRQKLPGLYQKTFIFCSMFWLMQVIFILMDRQAASVIVAIAFVSFFSAFTFYAAIICLKRGHRDAIYYLIATVATLFGTAITALTVWGILPYSTLTYRAAEIAISIDALLLSLALAEQIRCAQKEKVQAQQLAHKDMLTGLNNRRAFLEISSPIWHNAVRHNQALCIILLDLDKFKHINDTHGHAVGDLVLKETAMVLNNIVREGDVLARWGGEEFAILLPQTSIKQATQIAERIRAGISKTRVSSDISTINVTASLGVAIKDETIQNIDDLFKAADIVLYQAKQNGRNMVCAILADTTPSVISTA